MILSMISTYINREDKHDEEGQQGPQEHRRVPCHREPQQTQQQQPGHRETASYGESLESGLYTAR